MPSFYPILLLFLTLLFSIHPSTSWIIRENNPTSFSIHTSDTPEDNIVRSTYVVPGTRILSFYGKVISQTSRCTLGDGSKPQSDWYWEMNISTAYSSYDLIPISRWIWSEEIKMYKKEQFDPNSYQNAQLVPVIRSIAPYNPDNFVSYLPTLRLNCTDTNSLISDTGLTILFYGFTQKYIDNNPILYPPEPQIDNCNLDPLYSSNIYCRKNIPFSTPLILGAVYSAPTLGISGAYLAPARTNFVISKVLYKNSFDDMVEYPYYKNQLMFGTYIELIGQKFDGTILRNNNEQNSKIGYILQFYNALTQRFIVSVTPLELTFAYNSPNSSFKLPDEVPLALQTAIEFKIPIRVSLRYEIKVPSRAGMMPVGYYPLYNSVYIFPFENGNVLTKMTGNDDLLHLSVHGMVVPAAVDFVSPTLVDSDGSMILSTNVPQALRRLNPEPVPTPAFSFNPRREDPGQVDPGQEEEVPQPPISLNMNDITWAITIHVHMVNPWVGQADTVSVVGLLYEVHNPDLEQYPLICEVRYTTVIDDHYLSASVLCKLRDVFMIDSIEQISFHSSYQFKMTISYQSIRPVDPVDPVDPIDPIDPIDPTPLESLSIPQKISILQNNDSSTQNDEPLNHGLVSITRIIPKVLISSVFCDRKSHQYYHIHAYKPIESELLNTIQPFYICFQCPQPHLNDDTKAECVLDEDKFIYGHNDKVYADGRLRCPSLYHLPHQSKSDGASIDLTEPCHSIYTQTNNQSGNSTDDQNNKEHSNHCKCLNGGVCHYRLQSKPGVVATETDLTTPIDINPFLLECKCPAGFGGRYCQIDLNCKNIPQCDGNKDHYFNTFLTEGNDPKLICSKSGTVQCQCPSEHRNDGSDDGNDTEEPDDGHGEKHQKHQKHQNQTDFSIPTPFINYNDFITDISISYEDIYDPWIQGDINFPLEPCKCQKEISQLCHPEHTHPISYTYQRCTHTNHFRDSYSFAPEPVSCVCKEGWAGHDCSSPVLFISLQLTNNNYLFAGNDHFFLKSGVRHSFLIFLTGKLRIIFHNDNLVAEIIHYNSNTRTVTLQLFTPLTDTLRKQTVTLPLSTSLPPLMNHIEPIPDPNPPPAPAFIQDTPSNPIPYKKIPFQTVWISEDQRSRDDIYQVYFDHIANSLVSSGDWGIAARFAPEIMWDPLCSSSIPTSASCPTGPKPISFTHSDQIHNEELTVSQGLFNTNQSINTLLYPRNWAITSLVLIGMIFVACIIALFIWWACVRFARRVQRFLPQVVRERRRVQEGELTQYRFLQEDNISNNIILIDPDDFPSQSALPTSLGLGGIGSRIMFTLSPNGAGQSIYSEDHPAADGGGDDDDKNDTKGAKSRRRPSDTSSQSLLAGSELRDSIMAPEVEPPRPLPHGWRYVQDQYGKAFYINLQTMVSQLHHPYDKAPNTPWGDGPPLKDQSGTE